ncbi:DHA2 family efflux MFS transporter permease subunit [Streptacidiphilus carbonis]|jgi:EmrB/QacA subfamily drug resistance transporter|uniref:DHA2 family efflux MFS transporter permease subunit n=1 Tax=Streptacidiphilus carbonis TaxID=105422 RepID=UPI0005AB2693|nr:DHA2 family efflux MFS transporter permease subunit [Streptacidiphilus carbonis]
MAHRHLSQRVVVPVMFVATVFIVIVDGAITTVALPAIARQFQLAPARLDAVVVVYPVCVGVAVPASAWLGDRFGGKRLLLASMALFAASSALCGAAGNLGTLVAFRALQGLAGGLLTPVAGALLFRTFSARERVRASRVLIFPQQIAPAVAPILGGVLVDGLSWRWVFYVNLPLGLAAVLFGLAFLEPHRPEQHGPEQHGRRRFDLPGLLLSAGGLAGLTYGICAGSDHGWTSPGILLSLLTGAALLAATVHVELRTRDPILRLTLFRDRLFRDCSVISLIGLIPILGAMFLGPLFIQDALGGSAMDSGTSTFTEAFGVLLTVQVAGALYARVGPRAIIGGGLLGVAAVLVLFSTCDLHTSLWTFRLYMFLLGVAMGGVFMPTTVASMSTISKADMAQASTLNTVVRQTAGALAPAVVTTLLVAGGSGAAGSGGAGPSVSTYQDAYLVLAGIALLSALYAFTLRDGPARQAATSGIPEPAEPAPVG